MFVDKVTIHIQAGKGGNGAVSFHREKYIAAGGPDGGDGGRGGSIIFDPDPNMSTLMDFRYQRKYTAENGADGGGSRCSGKDGANRVIRVPVGTVVRDADSGAIMQDLSGTDRFTAAKGGRGGWGNARFATPTRQAPRFAKSGLPGEERDVTLELKLLADVGLVGFPNVGKSTLLSVVSKAHPKIANYHFTTLYPNLGVVYVADGGSFVMADIPGIIEGASEGAGLGHDFLRHVDRCRLLIHVVDASGSEGRDPVADFEAINEELRRYSPELAERPQIIAANKCDLPGAEEGLEKLHVYAKEHGFGLFPISAVTHAGVKELVDAAAARLQTLPPIAVFQADYIPPAFNVAGSRDPEITQYGDVWVVEGGWLERLVADVNFTDYESRMYFDRMLRTQGLFERLEKLGIQEGDTVSIYDMSFEYRK